MCSFSVCKFFLFYFTIYTNCCSREIMILTCYLLQWDLLSLYMYWQTLVQNACWLYTPLSTMTLSLRNFAAKLGLSLVIASITGSRHKAKALKLIETEGWSFRMVVIQTTVCCTLLRDVFHASFLWGELNHFKIHTQSCMSDWILTDCSGRNLFLGGVFLCVLCPVSMTVTSGWWLPRRSIQNYQYCL